MLFSAKKKKKKNNPINIEFSVGGIFGATEGSFKDQPIIRVDENRKFYLQLLSTKREHKFRYLSSEFRLRFDGTQIKIEFEEEEERKSEIETSKLCEKIDRRNIKTKQKNRKIACATGVN